MPFKRQTEKRLGFPFLRTISFNFQPFWNNLSQKLGVFDDGFGLLSFRIERVICFEDFKMVLLLQNFANLKILPCSLDWVCKVLEFRSISWYFWSLKTLFMISFLAFFLHPFTIAGLLTASPLVNTNLTLWLLFNTNGYSFYRCGVSLESYSPW